MNPDVVRSIVAIVFLVLGLVILVGLLLPGRGALTDWILQVIAPWFGAGRWLLPVLLIGLGVYLERARGPRAGWARTVLGLAIAYPAMLAMMTLLGDAELLRAGSGGRLGRLIADPLANLFSNPGAFAVLAGILAVGIVIAFDRPVRELVAPLGRAAGGIASALATPAAAVASRAAEVTRREPSAQAERAGSVRNGKGARDAVGRPEIPTPLPGPTQVSSVFSGGGLVAAATVAGNGAINGTAGEPDPLRALTPRRPDDVTAGADDSSRSQPREYRLPPLTLLEDVVPRNSDRGMDHERNAAIISGKLASFGIVTRVVKWNAGPVVTQYEVEPDPSVKVSRIEGLADDLAMALAARTIRIEAPIPGKSVVGIEIPNTDFNVVAIRRILEDADVAAIPSKIAFALGRDVAGHARAADLARMPHLLIAGATGSGKSVMVNALIASLLMRATPDEVRLILVDPKRVELADYNGVPHLLVPVITESERARAALKWAVAEMETRYRRFAGATARNITSYNETRADPADRMPYLVIIIDELADLMMRDGRTVEDPIVRLAQKARATGIHLVLATQRPSVNVVTGLIKANFPSRIAFAMASQIDSRTIIDAAGAEDLIGRGDMLFQPSDLPRPIRLQGVFVSDREVRAVTAHWRAEAEPHYDLGIVEDDEESTGSVDDLADADADRLLRDAVGVIQEYDRASASLLQRRLKIGYARAARIIDQLEARGYIGAFDGSNARQVLRRDAGGVGRVREADGPDGDDG
ncbi:MAG TPA: DNA translocase FtsK 4TM domain-containing protein [Patescibacteria group bacterium]|nr:DNA translocase FtsK 4TM domain-containing protein [Patescibacteria group bacterium]